MFKDALKILVGFVDVFRWRSKKKKEGKREEALNAVIDSKRYDDKYK